MNPLKPLTSEQQKLVQDHLPMIDHFLLKQGFIHNYKIHNYDPRDLFQAGAEGLCIGAQRFDPNRGFTFSTYANIWFKSYIFEECTRNSVVCISRQLRRIINKIKMHQLYHPKASIQQSIEAFEKSKSRPISPGFKEYILKKQNIKIISLSCKPNLLNNPEFNVLNPYEDLRNEKEHTDLLKAFIIQELGEYKLDAQNQRFECIKKMRMNTLKSYEKAVQQYFFQGTLDSLPNFVQRYLMAIPPCDDSEWMAWEKTEKTKSSKEDLSVTEKTKSSSCESCEDKNTKTKPAI